MGDPNTDTNAIEDTQPVNHLAMSDADILNMPIPKFDAGVVPEDQPESEAAPEADEEIADTEIEQSESEEEESEADTDEVEADDDAEAEDGKDEEEAGSSVDGAEEPADSTDYKAQLDKLLAPFQANGRKMQVDNVEDAINLMKMGANYNKKMSALKPNLKMLKMLENNKLLDESSINYLIDLHNKNPDAIAKLVKDSGIDPLAINTEEQKEYSPTNHAVGDNQIALDQVLDDVSATPTGHRTLKVVSQEWDQSSKEVLAKQPQLIKTLDDQMQIGVFDRIVAKVDKERALGRLQGLSDIEAYQNTGLEMSKNGEFNDLAPQQDAKPAAKTDAKPKTDKKEAARKEKKRAAAPTKAKKPAAKEEFNPLAMSDEEFLKIEASKYK